MSFTAIGEKKYSLQNESNRQIHLLIYRFDSDDEFRDLHKDVLEPLGAALGSDQNEIDKEALQKSYKAHLERLGLISGKVKTHKNKNPEFGKLSGEFKRQSFRTTALGDLLLRNIDLLQSEAISYLA